MIQEATFGGGCFWGVEDRFRTLPGVLTTEVGYMGGTTKNPTYEQVCEGDTGHVEVVHLTFDTEQLSYEALVEAFWRFHNPTTPNQQGPDIGTQYRSMIFTYSAEQAAAAMASKQALEARTLWPRPIVTEIVPATEFTRGEEYHQQYHQKHGGSCAF